MRRVPGFLTSTGRYATGRGSSDPARRSGDAFVAFAINPDQTVIWSHSGGDVPEPVFILAQFAGDDGDSFDAVDLVELHQAVISITSAFRNAFHVQRKPNTAIFSPSRFTYRRMSPKVNKPEGKDDPHRKASRSSPQSLLRIKAKK